MTTRLTISSLAAPITIKVNTTFAAPLAANAAGPFVIAPGLTTKGALATVNLKSIGDVAAAKTTLILPGASTDYIFKTASGAVTISTSTINPITKKVTTTVIAALDLTKVAVDTPLVKFSDLTAKFHPTSTKAHTLTPSELLTIASPTFALENDTGVSKTDGITNDGLINVSGQAGNTISYSIDGGLSYKAVTGTSFDLPEATYAVGSIKVIATSANGSVSKATVNATAIVVDKTVAAPTITLASDTGSSTTDGITSGATVNVSVEDGATWQYSINGLDFVNGTGTSFLLPANLTYDTGDIQVRQIDKAGNESDSGVNALSWSIDTKADAPVEIDFNDTGAVDGDNITKDGEFTVSDAEVGAKVSYSLDSGKTFTVSASNSFIVPEGTYAKGQIQIKQIDAAGNLSTAGSSTVALTVDETVVVPTIALTKDDGISLTDGITNVATVTVSGLEAGATWQYSLNGGDFVNGTGTTFTLPAGETYDAGQINVRQIDVAGNESDADGKFGSNAADWTILPSNIYVTAANTTAYDAGVADVKFFVAAGNYTYNISNFGTGDKIDFPTDNKPTVVNDNYTDNAVDLQYTYNGIKTTVHLTNLAAGLDSKLFDMNSFNTQFGTGTITNYGIKSSTPVSTVTHKAVSAAGSNSALTGDVSYDFATGKYDYSVSDFAKGDSLNFPAGVKPTVDNGSYTDKQATVQWTQDGSLVRVTLTGLNDQQDAAIFDASSFKTLFGTDSITNNGGATVAPVDGATLTVSATGSSDASLGRATFSFAPGTYDYTITGFGSGDVLDFPNDVHATIDQTSYTDNNIGVQWATGGSLIRVTLIGASSDSGVYDFVSFNNVFGAGSLV